MNALVQIQLQHLKHPIQLVRIVSSSKAIQNKLYGFPPPEGYELPTLIFVLCRNEVALPFIRPSVHIGFQINNRIGKHRNNRFSILGPIHYDSPRQVRAIIVTKGEFQDLSERTLCREFSSTF